MHVVAELTHLDCAAVAAAAADLNECFERRKEVGVCVQLMTNALMIRMVEAWIRRW